MIRNTEWSSETGHRKVVSPHQQQFWINTRPTDKAQAINIFIANQYFKKQHCKPMKEYSMKTIATIALAAGIALSPVIAQAAFQGPAATPDSANNMTVSDVLSLKLDREYVCMTGNIVNKVMTDHEKYTFRDATGSMVIEIEDKVFAGQEVTPETRIRICGEVDTETFKPNEFDAEGLQILR